MVPMTTFAHRSRYGADTLPAVTLVATDGTLLRRISKLTEADDLLAIIQQANCGPLTADKPCRP